MMMIVTMIALTTMITITKTDWLTSATQLRALRSEVFIKEQGISPVDEWDEQDTIASHYLVSMHNTPIACARLMAHNSCAKIGRVAVLKPYRRQKIATQLLQYIINNAKKTSLNSLYLDAQLQAISLYEALGFIAENTIFLDAGIQHKRMHLNLMEQP